MNRQIGLKNFIRVVILDPQTKGHVIQRMRNPKIAMVRYGLTEIAGQDNDGQPNLQGLTLQDKLARPVY